MTRVQPEPGVSVPSPQTVARLPVLGTNVSASTFDAACETIAGWVRDREPRYVSCANVYSLMLARDVPEYQRMLNGASYVTADGMPVVWALRAFGVPAERVHNDDLFFSCCERYPQWRHVLVGGREGQPQRAAEEAMRRFPSLRVVGAHPTPDRPVPPERTRQIIDAIREVRPDVVWVGMGTPAQDFWMASAVAEAGVPMVACGSLFDLLTGHTRPAPAWMKRAGLQWLFRLAQEPRRLAFRYLTYNPRFMIAIAAEMMRRPRRPRS